MRKCRRTIRRKAIRPVVSGDRADSCGLGSKGISKSG